MELYNLYFIMLTALGFFGLKSSMALGGIIGAVVLWAGLFTLQAFGMYAMAKKQKVEKRWMAFIPFVNLLFMGKLAGECNVFGQKVKRAGLYAMLAQIITTAFCLMEIFSVVYLYTVEGTPSFDQFDQPYWSGVQGFSLALTKYLSVSELFLPIVQMIYEIMAFIIVMALYKKYVPNSHFALSVLCLFFPLARYVIMFVIRNRPLVDYEAYIRARHEEYMRQRGYTPNYGAPYTSPNGTGEQPAQQPPEDPFEEFNEKGAGDNDGDEFFS